MSTSEGKEIDAYEIKKNPTLVIDERGSKFKRNPLEIRCICTRQLLVISADKEDSQPTLNIACQKLEMTCFCGKVHVIENKPLGVNMYEKV